MAFGHRVCHRSLSQGVGARYILLSTSSTSNRHRSSNTSISLTPITNPFLTECLSNPVLPPIYSMPLRFSPWLWFSFGSRGTTTVAGGHPEPAGQIRPYYGCQTAQTAT